MRGNFRKSIASSLKLPQFTTMNVIDGQAGLICYSSLIFYSLTIDNILNIIVLLILAGVSISAITGSESAMEKAKQAKNKSEAADELDTVKLAVVDAVAHGNDGFVNEGDLANALEGIISDDQIETMRADVTGAKAKLNGPWTITGKTGNKYVIEGNGSVKEKSDLVIELPSGTTELSFTEGGASVQLTAKTSSNLVGKTITWSSSNTSVATVDQTGKVTYGTSPTARTTTITAEIAGTNNKDTVTVTYVETQFDHLAVVSPSNGEGLSLLVGGSAGTIVVEGRAKYETVIPVTVTASSSSSNATVTSGDIAPDSNGQNTIAVTPVAQGNSIVITVTAKGTSKTATVGANVKKY